MTSITAGQVRSFLLELYAEQFSKKGMSAGEVPDGFDLLNEGIIDSLGILELVTSLESRFELRIDFEDMDAERFTRIGDLSRYVAANAGLMAHCEQDCGGQLDHA